MRGSSPRREVLRSPYYRLPGQRRHGCGGFRMDFRRSGARSLQSRSAEALRALRHRLRLRPADHITRSVQYVRIFTPLAPFSNSKDVAEKVSRETKSVPQRLKPRCDQSTCGTAEAVPLSKTDFSAPL